MQKELKEVSGLRWPISSSPCKNFATRAVSEDYGVYFVHFHTFFFFHFHSCSFCMHAFDDSALLSS